jgi:hypothetical protein
MNAVARTLLALVIIALLGYAGMGPYGWRLGPVGFSWDPTRERLSRLTNRFLDDIRFKDFAQAATYHTASDQVAVNIPQLIESKFAIKPEQLDIQETRIDRIDVDPDGRRAKSVTTWHTKLLNTSEVRDVEAVIFWHKAADGHWYMQLRSSL